MRIPLDRESRLPLYQQIVEFLAREIKTGALAPNTRLPSSRELAGSIGVNRITVNNAYGELEAEGLIFSRLGSGTYVAPSLEEAPKDHKPSSEQPNWPQWQLKIAAQTRFTSQTSMEQDLTPNAGRDLISFAQGIGSAELFPVDDFRKSLQNVLSQGRTEALSYGPTAGYLPLRATISHILADQGIPTRPENLIITSGSQQALWLVASLMLRAGDTVLVESPTYTGTLNLFRAMDAHIVSVPVDEEGMQVELVEELLCTAHPSLIYTIPTFQNPTGTCLSSYRRRQLIALAGRYNVPILEDEFVGDLRYEGHSQPALKALDPDGRVIYVSTFSKMLMPGLRVGYMVANGPVYDQLLSWKRLNDIATSALMQRALEAYITVGRYQTHLHRASRAYRAKRDLMVQALSRHMPQGVRWFNPQGGLFIWTQLPAGLMSNRLLPLAAEEGVDFVPGSLFFADQQPSPHLRLNFASVPTEQIEEGIRRLVSAIQRYLQDQAQTVAIQLPVSSDQAGKKPARASKQAS